jgi:hypothetical protein
VTEAGTERVAEGLGAAAMAAKERAAAEMAGMGEAEEVVVARARGEGEEMVVPVVLRHWGKGHKSVNKAACFPGPAA